MNRYWLNCTIMRIGVWNKSGSTLESAEWLYRNGIIVSSKNLRNSWQHGFLFLCKKHFWKNLINMVYKILFSVLIYEGVEQNIDFNSHFDLMFLFNLFNFIWLYPQKRYPRNFYIMRGCIWFNVLVVFCVTNVVVQWTVIYKQY